MKLLFSLCLLLSINSYCNYTISSEINQNAVGNNFSLTTNTAWGSSSNPACFIENRKYSGALFYSTPFLIKDISIQAFAFNLSMNKKIQSRLALERLSYSNHSTNQLSISSGMKFNEKLKIGLLAKISYIKQVEERSILNIWPELGAIYSLNDNLILAATIKNFIPLLLKNKYNENNQTLSVGLNYQFSKKLKLNAQLIFQNSTFPIVGVGIDYQIHSLFYTGLNFNSGNQPIHFAIGYQMKNIQFKLGFSYHQTLGFSPSSAIYL